MIIILGIDVENDGDLEAELEAAAANARSMLRHRSFRLTTAPDSTTNMPETKWGSASRGTSGRLSGKLRVPTSAVESESDADDDGLFDTHSPDGSLAQRIRRGKR